jgi:dsDNA-binding SOS-regulon protein
MLEVLGTALIGYDIGCQFHSWAMSHPKLAKPYLKELCRAIVGAFHGASHRRLCQLLNLPLYNKGCGLEALETCEIFFSKSNALAGVTRTASRFHRQQEIVEYLAHANANDAYGNLCECFRVLCACCVMDAHRYGRAASLLVTKYKAAIAILDSLPALEDSMRALGVENREVFEMWLEEQKECLSTVLEDVPEETLQLEYYQKLVNLQDLEYALPTWIIDCL